MTTLAHLTDLHLLEPDHASRDAASWLRLEYLSFGRAKAAGRRRQRVLDALAAARHAGADHVVITGDLTEDGTPEQLELLAETLAASGWAPARVTLVPGNHDAYDDAGAWDKALAGPLAPWRRTSTEPVELADVTLVPIAATCAQSFLSSRGAVDAARLEPLEAVAREARRSGRPVVAAMHHPPRAHGFPLLQWIDGLTGAEGLAEILDANDHVAVLHGHTHQARSASVRPGGPARVFSARAVVDGDGATRLYEARHGALWPAPEPPAWAPVYAST